MALQRGSPAGAGPCGIRAGPGPAQRPPRGGGGGGPVTKLPSYRRIRELLTGAAAANQREAPLFSGRRPGDTRTFPRHPAQHTDTQSRRRAHTHCPGDTHHHPSTHNHGDTHSDMHGRSQERAGTQHHTDTQNLCGRQSRDTAALPRPTIITVTHRIPGAHVITMTYCTVLPTHNITPTHSITDIRNHSDTLISHPVCPDEPGGHSHWDTITVRHNIVHPQSY